MLDEICFTKKNTVYLNGFSRQLSERIELTAGCGLSVLNENLFY